MTGFTKALARERADALVKCVDFARGAARPAALADLLLDETLRDPGAVEIGYADDLRWSVGLIERRRRATTRRARRRRTPCTS